MRVFVASVASKIENRGKSLGLTHFTFALIFFASLTIQQAQALIFNTQIESIDDPNNYLALDGVASVGDDVSFEISFNGQPADNELIFSNRTTYVFFSGQAPSSVTVNGALNPTPNPAINPAGQVSSVTIVNDYIGDTVLGPGDLVFLNQVYSSPDPAFNNIFWSVVLTDSTGSLFDDNSYFQVDETNLNSFNNITIIATAFDSTTEPEVLLTTSSPVPIPGTVWLLGSAFVGLATMKAKKWPITQKI